MMEKDQLRKADIFSGSLIVLLGLFIIMQAFGMPMKDSWGGVQNVWYVSPALFPLLVGGMLTFLGLVLISIAFKAVHGTGIKSVLTFLLSSECLRFLKKAEVVRFYAIVFNLMVFVFLMVPRIDFFLGAILFLLVSFFMFYLGDASLLLRVFRFTGFIALFVGLFCGLGLAEKLTPGLPFAADWIVLGFIASLCVLVRRGAQGDPEILKKYRLSLIVAFVAPLTIGVIFKYFLLVPMPFEGLIVQFLDSIWYAEMWS
ncbi:MAG: hypothetical protein ACI8ZB_000208 [Desulforhopalus sp.]|jgi:hypothetical protein